MNEKKSVCLTILRKDIHQREGFVVTNVKYNTRTIFSKENKQEALAEYKKQEALNHIPKNRKYSH